MPVSNRQTLVEQFIESSRVLHRKFWLAHHAVWRQLKLHPAQAHLLKWLDHHDPTTIKSLAEAMDITSSAATQAIRPLTKLGLVRQESAKNDRRQQHVILTTKGRQRVLAIRRKYRQQAQTLLRPLSETDLSQMVRLYRKLVK